MTTPPVPSITDEQLAELSLCCEKSIFKDDAHAPVSMGELRGLITRLRAAERGDDALREKADKYATIERVMAMLKCDEREGGIWTACTLLLIGSAHKMNSVKSVIDQEGVTVAGEHLGNWRVTVECIDTAMERNP